MSKGEEKQTHEFFTWFGKPCLRLRLHAIQAWGFHYPSLSKASTITIDFEVSINLYNKEIISQSLHSSVSHTQTLTNKLKKWKIQWNSLNE